VVQSGLLVTVTPSPVGPNTAIVSYQTVGGATELDVNLNGTAHDFAQGQVGFVYYLGSTTPGAQTFENETNLHSVAWGGSGTNVFVSTAGQDEFFGGSGTNIFYAGSGYDVLQGGSGVNIYNESATGSGIIFEVGSNNTVNVPSAQTGTYQII
jgi:hypothetical protein